MLYNYQSLQNEAYFPGKQNFVCVKLCLYSVWRTVWIKKVNIVSDVGSEVLTAVTMKSTMFLQNIGLLLDYTTGDGTLQFFR
jgi:hypothetical protein